MSDQFESIKKGVEEALAWKRGKKTGARVTQYSAMDVAKIRKQTKMTQREFSDSFSIPLSTLRQWEQGQRIPQGPAQALLKIIAHDAKTALKAINR
ncbi:MAG: putative transcriptional regulator [Gammaproteobacteria bacterium]|jgi:putative transcriptional regulator